MAAGNGATAARLIREWNDDDFFARNVVEVVLIPFPEPTHTLMEVGPSATAPRGDYVSELPGVKIVPPPRRTDLEGPKILSIPSVVHENPSGETTSAHT